MDKRSMDYLGRYVDMTDEIKGQIAEHARKHGLEQEICAWYKDWDDFCSDWCDSVGYTKTQARELLHDETGEFMFLPGNAGIIRFAM